jgi:hypothetical protein
MKKKILALLSNVVLSAWKVSFSPSLYNSLPLSLSLSLSQSHTHTHTQTEFPHFMKILIKSGDFAIK